MPNVSIIIVNYNCWQDTIECLESLKKIIYKNFSVIIIDNASSDNSFEQIIEYIKRSNKLPHSAKRNGEAVTSYQLHKNTGFAGGNNIGIERAVKQGTDYVLLLNPDTIVELNFLYNLIEVAEQWKQKGKLAFFGPRIYLQDTRYKIQDTIYSNGGIINLTQTKGTLKDYGQPANEVKETEPFQTDYISGTCLLLAREIIEKIGLMREEYFLYYEDTDWAIRAKKQGIAQVIAPQSVIWHKKSATTNEGSFNYIYYHVRNGLYCGWRNGNFAQKIAVFLLSAWTFIKQPVKFFIPSKKRWAKPVIKGVIDFLKGRMGKYNSTL